MSYLKKLWPLLALALLSTLASAQTLNKLLPQGTIFALGTQDLGSASSKFKNFQDEFNKLDVAGALAAIFPAEAVNQAENSMSGGAGEISDLGKDLKGLNAYDLLGQESWLDIATLPSNPLPAITFLTKVSPKAQSAIGKFISDVNAEHAAEVQTLKEGGTTFYVLSIEEPDSPISTIAYTEVNDLVAFSTNPDVLRGVLRRLNGSAEAGFTSAPGYQSTLGMLKSGNFYSYLSYGAIAQALTPLAQSFNQSAQLKLDALIQKLSSALTTAGVSGSVWRITDKGLESKSMQAVNAQGGDQALYTLLTNPVKADAGTLNFVPADALSYSSRAMDLTGWWDYLNSLAASVPQLGGDLDQLLKTSFNIDLRQAIFSWTGGNVSTITAASAPEAKPGAPSSNLLGNSVYVIASKDDAAAGAGLASLIQDVGQTVSAMTNPQGESTLTPKVSTIAGVEVTSYDVSSGISLSYAVTKGNVFIATSKEAMTAVLTAAQSGQTLANQAAFKAASKNFPADASAISYADEQKTVSGLAQQLSTTVQTVAGLGGSENLDIQAVQKASKTIEQFMDYVASRMGSSYGYSERTPSGIHGYSMTQVNW